MLELEVIPERSLGCEQWQFVLGMHFSQAVAIMQQQVDSIKSVQILYSEQSPLTVDIIIHLVQDGIRLIFDAMVQRLKVIEVCHLKKVRLKYGDSMFNSEDVEPTIDQIDESFGATHPGVYDKEKHIFTLHFRGLSFSFDVESKFQPQYAHGLGSLQFPNGASPIVSRMSIYSGSNLLETVAPSLPLSCFHNRVYVEEVSVMRKNNNTTGIKIKLLTEGSARQPNTRKESVEREVNFGDSCEDVATALGSPSRVFYKSEEKMKIHCPSAYRKIHSHKTDFFYNYFTLGLDILFDANTLTVKKFVLHTNFPGHYNFNMYHRCDFNLPLTPSKHHKFPLTKQRDDLPALEPLTLLDMPPSPKKAKSQLPELVVTACSKWEQILEHIKVSQRPVILNRSSSTNTTNPFGSTFSYGYQDVIFEVMANGHLASVTLYDMDICVQH